MDLDTLFYEEDRLDDFFNNNSLSSELVDIALEYICYREDEVRHMPTGQTGVIYLPDEAIKEIETRIDLVRQRHVDTIHENTNIFFENAYDEYATEGRATEGKFPHMSTLGYWLLLCPVIEASGLLKAKLVSKSNINEKIKDLIDNIEQEIGELEFVRWMWNYQCMSEVSK